MKNSDLLHNRNVFYLRRSFRLGSRLERGMLDPASMVDIALIFFLFLITSSAYVTQPGVRITLPVADNLEGIPFSSLVVTVSPDHSTNDVHSALVFFDDVRTDLEGLSEAFSSMSDEQKSHTLIIQADEKVTNKVIVDISGKALAAGIKDVAIAARFPPPKSAPSIPVESVEPDRP
ncbi:MAG: biopolymer transport protein ExbD [Kiritimatiellia bacterium]|jgi:biopolymer transport protein ExbD